MLDFCKSGYIYMYTIMHVYNIVYRCSVTDVNYCRCAYLIILVVNSEVRSDRLSDQRIRREPKGLSYICMLNYESDHDVRSIMCMV